MQKLSNYEAAQQRLVEMEALEEAGKGTQVKDGNDCDVRSGEGLRAEQRRRGVSTRIKTQPFASGVHALAARASAKNSRIYALSAIRAQTTLPFLSRRLRTTFVPFTSHFAPTLS